MVRTPSIDKSGLKKGTWTAEEDRKLIAYVTRYGCWNWRQLPRFAGLARCGKSCRLRWMNYLRPNIKRGNYTPEEEEIIIKLHNKLGNRWSAIAAHLPGRTDNEIKNHWHTALKKKKTQQHEQSKNSSSSSHSSVSSISSSYSSDKSPTCRNSTRGTSCHVDSTPLSPQTSTSSAITMTHDPNPILDLDLDLVVTQDFWSDLINISNGDDFFLPTQTTTTIATTCTSTSSQQHPSTSTSTSTISSATFDLDHDDFSFLAPLSDAAIENFLLHPSSPQTTPSLSSELQYQYLYPSSLPFDDFDLWSNQAIF